jgi:hypothetical protein
MDTDATYLGQSARAYECRAQHLAKGATIEARSILDLPGVKFVTRGRAEGWVSPDQRVPLISESINVHVVSMILKHPAQRGSLNGQTFTANGPQALQNLPCEMAFELTKSRCR